MNVPEPQWETGNVLWVNEINEHSSTSGVPIVLIVFNRPRLTAQSFELIRQQRPERLYVVADGPRPGVATDAEACEEVRRIVEAVDWPCEVFRDYADTNLGLKARVMSGLNWVFSQEERAIILEDDCMPNEDFFGFCSTLLDRYADDDEVLVVTGNNFQNGVVRGDGSYYFSRYNHCWGWATWKRAWELFDPDIAFWPAWRDSPDWPAALPDDIEREYWQDIFDRVAAGEIDSWAYPWTACAMYHERLTATPNVNLVSNIGFGTDATHTTQSSRSAFMATQPLGDLVHPESVVRDADADRAAFDNHFGGQALRARSNPVLFVRWAAGGVVRRSRRFLDSRRRSP